MKPNIDKLERALYIAADMQKIGEVPDKLTNIINECTDIEITEEELDFVSAAASMPEQNYRIFMEKLAQAHKQ